MSTPTNCQERLVGPLPAGLPARGRCSSRGEFLCPSSVGATRARKGKSLILSPRVESSQRLRFIPKKRKEGERKEKGLQQRKRELPEGGLRKPPKCRQRAMRKWHGNRRGRFPKQPGRIASDREKGGKDSWRGLPHSMQPFRLLSRGFC